MSLSRRVSRLGGTVTRFVEGAYPGTPRRVGFQVFYSIYGNGGSGEVYAGRLDVAALPVRSKAKEEASICMMLYMLRDAMNGLWFLQQLSPGYSALMPFLLVNGGDKTVTQLWSQQSAIGKLLPPPGARFVEGEVING